MRRTLWGMSDDEVYVLREKAHRLLSALYLDHVQWLAWIQKQKDRIEVLKHSGAEYARAENHLRQAYRRVDHIEQRLAAQREFCNSLDTEFNHRNPPFWTRQDLDDMDSWRSHS